jgi:hypothetical protein
MAKVPAHKLRALVKESKKQPPTGSEHGDEEREDEDEDEDEEKEGGEDKGDENPGDEEEGGDEDLAEMVASAAGRVESGDTDDELMGLIDGYDPELDGNPPEWVADEATWDKAKAAVEKKWDDYDEPWAVVATVYESMHGKRK